MPFIRSVAGLVLLLVCHPAVCPAATWHVDVSAGSDQNSGLASDSPLRTIQKACDQVAPGDEVVVKPGVYFENLQLKRSGTAQQPIVFRTDGVGRNRVVITGASQQVREAKIPWTVEDEATGLYWVPFAHLPARVLYDGVDLFPYPSLEALRSFSFTPALPGPFHGFAFDPTAQRLYVRLHAARNGREFSPAPIYGQPRERGPQGAGPFGSTDPNRHVMSVSPPPGWGTKGNYLDKPYTYNWGILTEGPAHVILDGFTFETPGVAGVYVRGTDVVVRNAWFLGCKVGVAGGRTTDNDDRWTATDRVVMEQCDYSQFPCYADAEEVIAAYADDPRYKDSRFFWWARKGSSQDPNPRWGYEEGGVILNLGRDCILRRNFIHEAFDGFSAGEGGTANLQVYENRFERIVDNAIQTENHGANWRIHHNEFVDGGLCPISWQPLGGTPWPGPIYLYRNLIFDTQQGAQMWRRAGWPQAWLKAGVRKDNWKWYAWMKSEPQDSAAPPGDGFVVSNNTIVLHDGFFLERCSGWAIKLPGFRFRNNIFVVQPLTDAYFIQPDTASDWEFDHNLVAPPRQCPTGNAAVIAGTDGVCVRDAEALGLMDVWAGRFEPQPGSPAIGRGRPVPWDSESANDAGAVPYGSSWAAPVVGPRAR